MKPQTDPTKFRLAIVDVETSGLHPKHDFILELGIVIIDADLCEVAAQNWIGDRDLLPMAKARMDDVVLAMHTKNGLLDEMSRIDPRGNARPEIEAFLAEHTHGPEHTYLCGSSIHFDRDFLIEQTDLDLRKLFSRRVMDISTIKTFARLWAPSGSLPPREDTEKPHRALPDCRDSIEELRHYKRLVFERAEAAAEAGSLLTAGINKLLNGGMNSLLQAELGHYAAGQGTALGKKFAEHAAKQEQRSIDKKNVEAAREYGYLCTARESGGARCEKLAGHDGDHTCPEAMAK